jgi:hypothetical protein
MAMVIPPPFVLAISGTSLSSDGRLATPDYHWRYHLERHIKAHPACKSPVVILNTAKGSAQSIWGKKQSLVYAPMKPGYLLREDYSVNNCVAVGGGEQNTGAIVPLATADQDFEDEVTEYRAHNPAIKIAHMTMSSVGAGQTLRTSMEDWIVAGRLKATALDIPHVENYVNWPKPLDPALTDGLDELHPLWANAFELWSWPQIRDQVDTWIEEHYA